MALAVDALGGWRALSAGFSAAVVAAHFVVAVGVVVAAFSLVAEMSRSAGFTLFLGRPFEGILLGVAEEAVVFFIPCPSCETETVDCAVTGQCLKEAEAVVAYLCGAPEIVVALAAIAATAVVSALHAEAVEFVGAAESIEAVHAEAAGKRVHDG